MVMTPENTVPFPDNIKPHISTSLAWDNIDRLEETLSGVGTLHRVNGIAIPARQTPSNVMVLEFANVFLVCMLSLDVIVSAHFLEKEN